MRMQCNLPDHARAVEALLEGFVLCCQVILEAGLAPLDPRDSTVRYQEEPRGEEDWKLPQNVVRDGWGDCEDLAGWRAAGLRLSGEDPGARVVVTRTGKNKLHAVVQRSDGSLDDPSRELRARQKTMLGATEFQKKHGGEMRDHRKATKAQYDSKWTKTGRGGASAVVFAPGMDPNPQEYVHYTDRPDPETGRVYSQVRREAAIKAGEDPHPSSPFGWSTEQQEVTEVDPAVGPVDAYGNPLNADPYAQQYGYGYDGGYGYGDGYPDPYNGGYPWPDIPGVSEESVDDEDEEDA